MNARLLTTTTTPAGDGRSGRDLRRIARLLTAGAACAAAIAPVPAAQAADMYRVEIVNSRSDLRADVMWASMDPYQGVILWPNNTSRSQEFDLLDSGNGYFRIRARHSGQCLMADFRAGYIENGTRIMQYPGCGAGYPPSEWRVGYRRRANDCSGGYCVGTTSESPILLNRTGWCLDAANPSSNPPRQQAALQLWDCIATSDQWNAANQIFYIRQLPQY